MISASKDHTNSVLKVLALLLNLCYHMLRKEKSVLTNVHPKTPEYAALGF
jgi:hypothetical protein